MGNLSDLIKAIDGEAERRGVTSNHLCRLATGNPQFYKRLFTRAQRAEDSARTITTWIAQNPDMPRRGRPYPERPPEA